VVGELVRDRPAEQMPQLQKRLVVLRDQIGTRITLLTPDGRVLADTDGEPALLENHADRPDVQGARDDGSAIATHFSTTVSQPMMYGALRTGDGSEAVGSVRIAVPLDRVDAELARLRGMVWTTAAGTSLVGLALALWLARRITRPLRELTQAAEQI